MPCCSWTTGSPMRTSERSRTIASTLVRRAASRRPRRTMFAYSSASVTNASFACGHRKPACSGAAAIAKRSLALQERAERIHRDGLEAVLGEVLLHRLAAPGGLGDDQHAPVERFERALERGQRIVGAPVDLDRRQPARRRVGRERLGRRGDGQLDAPERLDRSAERIRRDEELGRRKQRARLVAAQQPVARLGVLPEAVRPRRRRRRAAR